MLRDNDLNKIAELAGIDASKLKDAISSENETEITIPNSKAFTADGLETLVKNTQKEGYDNGKVAGLEMTIKNFKSEKGLEFDGKDLNSLVTAIESKYKGSENEQISALQADKESLQSKILGFDDERKTLQAETSRFKRDMFVDAQINKVQFVAPEYIPEKDRESYVELQRRNAKTLFNAQYATEFNENDTPIIKANGEIVKNDLSEPETFDTVLNNFVKSNHFTTKQVKETSGGRGGGNSTLSKDLAGIKSTQGLVDYAEKKGIKTNSVEFEAMHDEFLKTNK